MENKLKEKSGTEQKAYLIINKQLVPLNQDVVRLGRHLDNDIVLHENAISRFHAEIHYKNGKYIIYDQKSTTGTCVNNQRIEHCVLNSGDLISLADLRFMFVNNDPGYLNQTRGVTQTLSADLQKRQNGEDHQTILVIDDEPNLLVGVAALLKRQGYVVIIAGNGADGLELARNTKPDLILSDIMMPPPNGFEVKRLLGMEPDLSTIPFIFLSAKVSAEDRILGIREGADDYITKPFHPEELLARIKTVFRRVETEQTRGREEMKVLAAQEMEKLRREIMQNIHHEFRTPLVNVMMPLELAVTNKFSNPEEQLHFIKMALSNLEHLDSLVTDIVLLTSLDQSTINTIRQPIDPQIHIIKPLEKRLQSYKSKNLDLVLDVQIEPPILLPRKEFTHSLLHLADNAFKFSRSNGRVDIKVHSTAEGGVIVEVKDEGIGIPKELQTKVFERFYQISQGDSRNYDGLGVGLTITKAISEILGGSLEFLEVESGCYVRMTIPGESQRKTL
jgi:two-component system, sensor histidine kinase and response regulator